MTSWLDCGASQTAASGPGTSTATCAALRKDDHLWILGDMTAGGHIPLMLEVVSGWPGVKHLVTGNHDPVGPHNRRGYRLMRRYLDVFESVSPYQRRRINGIEVMLSHYPYGGDHTVTDRYEAIRLRDVGLPLLHGHTHDAATRHHLSNRGTPQIHVGWDAWQRLVTEADIAPHLERTTP